MGIPGGDHGRCKDRRAFLSPGAMGTVSPAFGAGALCEEKAQAAYPACPFELGR